MCAATASNSSGGAVRTKARRSSRVAALAKMSGVSVYFLGQIVGFLGLTARA